MEKVKIKIYSRKDDSLFAVIDKEDLDKVSKYRWNINKDGYAFSRKSRKEHPEKKQVIIKLHRFVLGLGKNPEIIVDHIDGDTLNNSKDNLRIVTTSQNQMNCKTSIRNKINVKGVSYHKGAYRACIWIDGKSKHLGRFATIEEAKRSLQ